jgi:protein-ribulosamine 3-kinase
LGGVLQLIQEKQGVDKELKGLVEKVMGRVVERLIGDGQVKQGKGKGENVREGEDIVPVLVHGDLWSGNHGRGILQDLHGDEEGKVQEIVFDPSCCWAHGEYEWGIMKMFGGFGGDFERRYREIKGKDHPVEEWADRVELYEL